MFKKLIATIAFVVFGFFVSIGYSAIAQTNRTTPAPNAQLSPIDQQFITEAGQAAAGNIALSQLALQRGTSDRVKQFAQAEIQEQTQNTNDLRRITRGLGVTPPSAPAPKFQAALAQLSQLSGERFNTAYLDEGGINAHLESAALFQREAAFGQNRDLVALASRGLPIISNHFTTASQLTNYRFAQVPRRYGAGASDAALPRGNDSPANSGGTTTSPRGNDSPANSGGATTSPRGNDSPANSGGATTSPGGNNAPTNPGTTAPR